MIGSEVWWLVTSGTAVVALGAVLRRPDPDVGEWKSMLRRGSTRDHLFFFFVPWAGILLLSAGGMVLGAQKDWGVLALFCAPVALFSLFAAFGWGMFAVPYPLSLAPAWFRPIKAEDRERRRRERQSRKVQR